jgi:rare lipoprotein A
MKRGTCAAATLSVVLALLSIPGMRTASAKTPLAAICTQNGGKTASGEAYSAGKLTAAHRTLPFGTMVRVTNLRNRRSVVVRINDRGPFSKGRVIDLTPAAARQLAFSGLAPVSLQVVSASR